MTDIALEVTQQRAEGLLGASDAPAALGLDKYRAPLTLWRQLRGLPTNDEKPAYVQEAAEWGQALEPIVRGKYALATGSVIYVPQESTVKDGWLRATPDGFVALNADVREKGVTVKLYDTLADAATLNIPISGLLQVKTCSAYKRDEWEDWIPAAYEVQVRVEMAVTDLNWCDVVCLVGGQQMRGPFRVERDAKLEATILRDLRAFWEMVQSGTEPAVDGSDAWRKYASERMRVTPVVMDADEETEATIANWITARRTLADVKNAEAEHKTKILLRMSAAGATKIRSRHGVIPAYKTGGRTDWKGVAASVGVTQAPDRFKKPSNTWTLRAPDDEDE